MSHPRPLSPPHARPNQTPNTQQRIKWAIYLTIPVGVGYGLGSNQTTLEIIKRVVRGRAGGGGACRRALAVPRSRTKLILLPPNKPTIQPSKPPPQFPNAASDPQGDHGRRLQTLEDAYREHLLEQAVDAALADARAKNAAQGDGSSSSDEKEQKKSGGFWSPRGDAKSAESSK